jgi:hypothetical protein
MLIVGGTTEIENATYRVVALIEGLGPYGYALEAINGNNKSKNQSDRQ